MFSYSRLDGILVLITLTDLGAKVLWVCYADRLSVQGNILAALLLGGVYFYNVIVANHEFMHTAFFRSRVLNRLFQAISSANLLYPMAVAKRDHSLHHRYNNDVVRSGTTMDPTSTYRYGRSGKQEHFFGYCLSNIWRNHTVMNLTAIWRANRACEYGPNFYSDVGAACGTALLLILINWKCFVFGIISSFYIGWFLADLHNYYEHFAAPEPSSRYANSVSYYDRIYNLLTFNEGYHQEHHIGPGVHWTRRPHLKTRFAAEMNAAGASPANLPPVLGFLDQFDSIAGTPSRHEAMGSMEGNRPPTR